MINMNEYQTDIRYLQTLKLPLYVLGLASSEWPTHKALLVGTGRIAPDLLTHFLCTAKT